MTTLSEAIAEEAAPEYLAALGWRAADGPDFAPDEPGAERDDYRRVAQERRLRRE